MPSRGTLHVVLRVPEELRKQMTEAIAVRNLNSREEPWTESEFVRVAICEKLAKMERSRGGRGRGKLAKVKLQERLLLDAAD